MPDVPQNMRRRLGFRLSLRAFLLLVAAVAVVLATQYRRSGLSPSNVTAMRRVAQLDAAVREVEWSPDRSRLALLGWEKPVEICDTVSLGLRETFGEARKLIHFAFGPRGDVVAYCENGTTAVIEDRRTGETLLLDAGNDQPRMTFSPDGRLLATGGYGMAARLWDAEDGRLLHTLVVGQVEGGLTAAFSPDGRTLAVGNRNSTTAVFDTATGSRLYTLPRRMSHELQFSPDGGTLAVAYVDGGIAQWRASDGKLLAERQTQAEEVYTLDWSPDGELLATGGLNGKITLWDAEGLIIIRELPSPEWVIEVRFSPDGRNLIWAGGSAAPGGTRELQVWGIEGRLYTLLNRPR